MIIYYKFLDSPSPPSWTQTCNISKVVSCVPDYEDYIKDVLNKTYSESRESVRRGVEKLTDFKTACR